MTPLEKFIADSQRICDRSPGVLVLGGCSGRMITTTTGYIGDGFIADVDTKENAEFLVNSCTALPAALQHLRELSKKHGDSERLIDVMLKADNTASERWDELFPDDAGECPSKGSLVDSYATLSRRVAELEQRIADMQDEQRNPPTLRTVCEPMLQVQRAYDTHIGPNESLIPKEPKP